MMKKYIPLILIALLVLVSTGLSGCLPDTSGGLGIGNLAPNFTLKDMNGQSVSLKDYRGKYVVLNYWSTGCSPCVGEMPHLQEFYDALNKDSVMLLTINGGESTATVQQFFSDNGYTMPVLLDSDFTFADKYSIIYFPTTFFIDKEGYLKFSVAGAFKDKAALDRKLAELME